MTILHNFKAIAGVSAALLLGACADMNQPSHNVSTPYPQNSAAYTQYGVVQSINLVQLPHDKALGLGTIAGAVVGGILGNQVGAGSGNTAATLLGAAGGGYVGHELEKRNQSSPSEQAYRFSIRMSDGSYQAITQTSNHNIRAGDRVQIDNGVVRRY